MIDEREEAELRLRILELAGPRAGSQTEIMALAREYLAFVIEGRDTAKNIPQVGTGGSE